MGERIPHILPAGSASGNKLQKPSKESAYFSHLATLNFLFFTYRPESRGEDRGGEEERMAQRLPQYAPDSTPFIW